jgi:hypothetical protein
MWKRFFSSRWCVFAAMSLGMLLSLPSLKMGLVADDFFHWEVLTGRIDNAHPGTAFGMFSFADGNPERLHEFMRSGVFPWWASDSVRLSFWRPLSEFTHWFDYRLWPDSPVLMHVQNIVWYGAVIVALGLWLRAIDANKLRAGIATLIYAISATHGTAVGWIANRNALVAAFFSLLALIAFHRARQSVTRARASIIYVLSYVMFALSLLGGEAAIATAAYLFAYVVLLDKRSPLLARLFALLPFAIIVLIWKHFYSQFGYGSHDAGIYIDPVSEPLKFLYNAALRIPALLAGQFFGVPSIIFTLLPRLSLQILYSAIALALIAIFVVALRALNLHREKTVQFYALGALLAAVPVCAAGPDDRLLTFVGFGGAGLIAAFLQTLAERFKQTRGAKGIGLKIFAGYLILVHFIVAPATLPSNVNSMGKTMGPFIEYPAIAFPEEKLNANTRLMLINPPLPSCVAYIPFVRDYHGLQSVRAAFAMAPGLRAMTLEVLDDATVQITVPDGFIFPLDNFFRSPKLPFHRGDRIDLGDVNVTVIEVTFDGQPRVVQFEFPSTLKDPDLQFYAWDKWQYRPFTLPAPHQKIEIAAANFNDVKKRELSPENPVVNK